MAQGKVSVIIPVYNTELYIENCIDSVEKQTYRNFEIIIVNDGSTDMSMDKINKCMSKYDNIKLISITNHGQGYARNLAVKESTGDYILFLDSDDFIEKNTLELCVRRIEEDKSDLVIFDWKEYFYTKEKYRYSNRDKFFKNKILENEEVLQLLRIKHYFTVNKLYSKKFLVDNNITYGEGYIYEDNSFWVKIAINAKKVSLIHSPLYNIGIAAKSTTRNDRDTKRHYESYIIAIKNMIAETKKRPDLEYSYLYNYIMKKFNLYYESRVPKKYRKQFIKEYVEAMSEMVPLRNYNIRNTLIKLACKHDMFAKKKYTEFYLMYQVYFYKKNFVAKIKRLKNKFCKNIKKDINKIKLNIRFLRNDPTSYNTKVYNDKTGKLLETNILFMGFDYRYTGNSRYLFEQLKEKGYKNIKFVSEKVESLEEEYRIEPESIEMYEAFYTSKVVIFETWIPKKFRKKRKQIWIQLWHGSPLKKMLFDSEEKEIMEKSPKHKILKYNDIQRWNYLLSDNENINKYLKSAFLIKDEKIINYGYPRVKYLIENKDNEELKQQIREKVGVTKDKKIILYLPTWRDYNYGKEEEEYDRNYILNIELLKSKLGTGYEILEKNHVYLQGDDKKVMHNTDIETQELLLIADYLVSDYSSVIFDAFAIDLPVLIYSNDFKKYQNSRGVYEDIWNDLIPYVSTNIDSLADMIKDSGNRDYSMLKEKYAYKNVNVEELEDFVLEQLVYKIS